MISGITGNIFAPSGRDLNPTLQPTLHNEAAKTNAHVSNFIQHNRTDTVSISNEALSMAKGADKPGDNISDKAGRQISGTAQHHKTRTG